MSCTVLLLEASLSARTLSEQFDCSRLRHLACWINTLLGSGNVHEQAKECETERAATTAKTSLSDGIRVVSVRELFSTN